MNTKPKSKTAAPKQRSVGLSHKARWITYATVFVVLAAFAAISTTNIYNKNTIEKEHAEVARQLNEVATDLHKVYVNLKTQLPNVVESSFRNECAMSYSGPASKTYSCGPAIYLYKHNVEVNSMIRTDEVITSDRKFTSIHGLQTGLSNTGAEKYSYSDFLFDSISTNLLCHGYVHIYTDITSLERRTGKVFAESSLPVESIGIYCSKNLTYPVELENSWSQ